MNIQYELLRIHIYAKKKKNILIIYHSVILPITYFSNAILCGLRDISIIQLVLCILNIDRNYQIINRLPIL